MSFFLKVASDITADVRYRFSSEIQPGPRYPPNQILTAQKHLASHTSPVSVVWPCLAPRVSARFCQVSIVIFYSRPQDATNQVNLTTNGSHILFLLGTFCPLVWSSASEILSVSDWAQEHSIPRLQSGRHILSQNGTSPTESKVLYLPKTPELVERHTRFIHLYLNHMSQYIWFQLDFNLCYRCILNWIQRQKHPVIIVNCNYVAPGVAELMQNL